MTYPSHRRIALSLAGISMLGACGGNARSAALDSTSSSIHQPGSLESTSADVGIRTVGMADASQVQTAVEANMRVMMGASGDQLRAMVPEHRQLVSSMIAQMNHEMGSVHTASSAGWLATRDSIDNDLTRFPSMSAADLRAILPGHQARVHRLMQMRAGMMGGTGHMMPSR